jgi:hypothetical protein
MQLRTLDKNKPLQDTRTDEEVIAGKLNIIHLIHLLFSFCYVLSL